MEKAGYSLLIIASIAVVYLMVAEMISVFPEGIISLVAIIGIGLLIIKVVGERIKNKEDSYYSKNIDK